MIEKMDEKFEQSIPIIEVKNLEVKKEGVTILDIPELSIGEGEVLSLIGPNGAGKTTLLQTLSFLTKSFQGEIFFRGKKVGENYPIIEYRRKLSMVFQEPLLFDTTVFNNVAAGLKIRGLNRNEIRLRVVEELERFKIAHLSNRYAKTLSGGEAQRVSLARAFVLKPHLLFLDEPFSSLDSFNRNSLIEDLRHILQETGTTTIFATHDRIEALTLSDRAIILDKGKILQMGSLEEIANQPANEFIASFMGIETVLSGRVVRREEGSFIVSIDGQEIEAVGDASVGEKVVLCIKPEDVIISIHSTQGEMSVRNKFRGKIVKISSMGFFQRVHLQCGFPLIAYVTNHSLKELLLEEGKDVWVSFKATAITVIRKEG